MRYRISFLLSLLFSFHLLQAQSLIRLPQAGEKIKLHQGWIARKANEIKEDGNTLTQASFNKAGWIPARIPGTVLTTLLENKLYPAPEYGLNNNLIPDIYEVGNEFYTYWFVKEFEIEKIPSDKHLWLNFRGINYKAEIFLNGKRINETTYEGMFLRHHLDITSYIRYDQPNRLAVLVYPPTYPGNPNGGQGGDGMIARNNTMQFTPGWDWIQPVRDRNTGIWDEVTLTTSGSVLLQDPHIVTKVPGKREVLGIQKPAYLHASITLQNISDKEQSGIVKYTHNGNSFSEKITLQPQEKKEVAFKKETIKNPQLWWPNGIGEQPLYPLQITFEQKGNVSDKKELKYGIRELSTYKDPHTGGRVFCVNGRRIYITGGNYITSDWLLRFSPQRYEAEVRFHAEMNIRMIRVWGGALLERPEFYDACDKYGLLVFQDLWGSGDCNGAWLDPYKKESQARRQEYPDNHQIFLQSAKDQIKMIRNHASLCLWCGANEWPLAKDIDEELKNNIFPKLDPDRLYISYSTDTVFTHNPFDNNGDGPYGIQEPEWFYNFRSFPFNPESGSVGSPEIESMRLMMSPKDLQQHPRNGWTKNPTWRYHRDLGYGKQLERFGAVESIEDYCNNAQIVNYEQYRYFMEGRASRMWDWYTGILIWKTQNPWTALRGQMYDWFLDVNASLYGTTKGCETLHPFYNIVTHKATLLNSGLISHSALTVKAEIYNRQGEKLWENKQTSESKANQVTPLFDIPQPTQIEGVYFLKLSLYQPEEKEPLTTNIYWLTTQPKDYTSIKDMPADEMQAIIKTKKEGNHYRLTVTCENKKHISFFNRIRVFNKKTGERILPVHYTDNYITLMPYDKETIQIEFNTSIPQKEIEVEIQSRTNTKKLYSL